MTFLLLQHSLHRTCIKAVFIWKDTPVKPTTTPPTSSWTSSMETQLLWPTAMTVESPRLTDLTMAARHIHTSYILSPLDTWKHEIMVNFLQKNPQQKDKWMSKTLQANQTFQGSGGGILKSDGPQSSVGSSFRRKEAVWICPLLPVLTNSQLRWGFHLEFEAGFEKHSSCLMSEEPHTASGVPAWWRLFPTDLVLLLQPEALLPKTDLKYCWCLCTHFPLLN